jgi:DNA-binding SARP family transcriptional activator
MPHISLSLLGSIQAHSEGQAVAGFQPDKARTLLSCPAVKVHQSHRRDRVAGLLWPDRPNSTARVNLRHALNNLRIRLQDRQADLPLFLSYRQFIRFNPDSDYRS